ncbi:MAG: radical SAM family heme chaperone HemW [Bacteroidota bacterium]
MSQSQGGIYVHIPYCRQACVYCDFHFMTNLRNKAEMLEAMAWEAKEHRNFFGGQFPLGTLYFGGGTPSVLSPEELETFLVVLRENYTFAEGVEVTLEANPDDLDLHYLQAIRALGINRLSIGVQSFRAADLQWMNRSHTAEQALSCITDAQKTGFDNISIDLIFGLPDSDISIWQSQLEQAAALGVTHLSLYALTVEERTALAHQVKQGQTRIPDDPLFTEQFLFAHEKLEAAGYEHYELSNYAKPGYRSQHNSAYWQGKPYLGIGPSAHSFDGQTRHWNIAHNQKYIQAFREAASPIAESETLSVKDRYHEYIMTQVRKKEGIDMQHIEAEFVTNWQALFGPYIGELMAEGLMTRKENWLALTPLGWMLSDEITRELFV